jgi:hypothetical protein
MTSSNPAWEAYEKSHPIIVPIELDEPHPITQCTAAEIDWPLRQAPDTTTSLFPPAGRFSVHVSERNKARALRLVDALVKACEARGFELRSNSDDSAGVISVFVNNESLPLRLVERGTRVTYLLLESDADYGRKSWRDSPLRPLEKRLNKIMIDLRTKAATRIATRVAWEESERKTAEFARMRSELRDAIAYEREPVNELVGEAEGWQKARVIRAYLAAFTASTTRAGTLDDNAEWIAWAYDQADRLDPLRPSPPSVLDTPRNQYREPGLNEYLDEDGTIKPA